MFDLCKKGENIMGILDGKILDFLEIIQTSVSNFRTVIAAISRAFDSVADELGLGRVEIVTDKVPGTSELPGFRNQCLCLYDGSRGISGSPRVKKYVSRNTESVEIRIYQAQGVVWNEEQIKCIDFVSNSVANAIDRARMSELLLRANSTDVMTGMNNTDGFMADTAQLIASGHGAEYTAFYMNIANFKYVNKVVSYKEGDIVLAMYADRLKKFIFDDEVIGRLGGDNFVAVIRNTHAEEFLNFISRMTIEFTDTEGKTEHFEFGAVVGAFRITADVHDPGIVMVNISSAYQCAKEVMHLPIVYSSPEIMAGAFKAKELKMKFGDAIKNREFSVVYQPKVDIRTDRVYGAEGLVRWILGNSVIPPVKFIPALEKDGKVCQLDFYVYDQVCSDISKWKDMGVCVPVVSSNFSRWHLRDEDFIDKVTEIADKYGVEHKLVEIEFTETTNDEEYHIMQQYVTELHKRGFLVAMDDFGTGYSSLRMLKEVPIDILKMDKTLIDIKKNEISLLDSDKVMMKHIVGLANDLNIQPIAEGVETAEQRDYLKSIGCNYVQGYLYDRPLDISEFEKRLRNPEYAQLDA